MRNPASIFTLLLFLSFSVAAQETGHEMNMPGMHDIHGMQSSTSNMIANLEQHTVSGTDLEPNSTPSGMIMLHWRSWMLMFHGEGFINELQQSGPRGGDKFFSTNWSMPMAQKPIGHGVLTLRAMLSLEPATVSDRRYPELFQQGETAFGRAIVDGQHPHDLVMELAGIYDYNLNEHTAISFYAAPIGDPALGPPAYPHRASAAEDPVAPLGHHLQDSTHIAADVLTAGLTYRNFRLEASGFHGREPDEYRWNIDSGAIDSWSTRLTFNPGQNWSFQYSIGQLISPEALAPEENLRRMTASLFYNLPLRGGNWASMVLWGRNQNLQTGNVGNGFLVESTFRFLDKNSVWMRAENVDRTTELLSDQSLLPVDAYFARVQAYTAGYDREVGHIPHLSTAIGGQLSWYGVPSALRSDYGAHPVGAILFLRLRAR